MRGHRRCAIIPPWRRGFRHLSQPLEVGAVTGSGLYNIRGARRATDIWCCSFHHPCRLSARFGGISSLFFDELLAVLETMVVYACPVVIGDDFNVNFQLADGSSARRMRKLLTGFNMVQHVSEPTHGRG